MRFSLGVNYRPADPHALRADFAQMAALGLDTVRFFVDWEALQPAPEHIAPAALDELATIVDLAGEAGLEALPVLFSGNADGVNRVPAWALDPRAPRGEVPVMTSAGPAASGVGNIYAGPLLDAQLRAAAAAGERLRGHRALRAWDIGNRFSDVRAPSRAKVSSGDHSQTPADEHAIADWSRRLAKVLTQASGAPVTAGTFSGDLTEDRNVRLGSLCAPLAFASMQGSALDAAFGRGRLDPETLPFLAMLTAGFSYKPVLITAFGNPTCPPGKFSAFERNPLPDEPPNVTIAPDDSVFATYPCLTEDENAAYCAATLERLHADGRLGAYWSHWADAAPDTGTVGARTGGIVRADGSPKPVAAVFSAFARQGRDVRPAADMPSIAGAYYYRTLPTSTHTLYEAYLRFVAERRQAARDEDHPPPFTHRPL